MREDTKGGPSKGQGEDMKREYSVAVLGGDPWGLAIADLLAENYAHVPLWVRGDALRGHIERERRHPALRASKALNERVDLREDLEPLAREANVLFIAIPSRHFREVATLLGPHVEGDQFLISVTRGLEKNSGLRMSQIIREETCALQVGALGGPASAEELLAGRPGAVVVGSRFDALNQCVQHSLGSERLRVYGNRDIAGVEMGGALANIMIFACGVARGIGTGAGAEALIVTRGLAEVGRVGHVFGADSETFDGLAFLGDLVAALLRGKTADYRLGLAIAKGRSLSEALEEVGEAECVDTARVALQLALEKDPENPPPLIQAMNRLLFEGISPEVIVHGLMTRKAMNEGV